MMLVKQKRTVPLNQLAGDDSEACNLMHCKQQDAPSLVLFVSWCIWTYVRNDRDSMIVEPGCDPHHIGLAFVASDMALAPFFRNKVLLKKQRRYKRCKRRMELVKKSWINSLHAQAERIGIAPDPRGPATAYVLDLSHNAFVYHRYLSFPIGCCSNTGSCWVRIDLVLCIEENVEDIKGRVPHMYKDRSEMNIMHSADVAEVDVAIAIQCLHVRCVFESDWERFTFPIHFGNEFYLPQIDGASLLDESSHQRKSWRSRCWAPPLRQQAHEIAARRTVYCSHTVRTCERV